MICIGFLRSFFPGFRRPYPESIDFRQQRRDLKDGFRFSPLIDMTTCSTPRKAGYRTIKVHAV